MNDTTDPKARESELLPCPFCGNQKVSVESSLEYLDEEETQNRWEKWKIICSVHDEGCGGSSGFYDTVELATQRWNTRSLNHPPTETVCGKCGATWIGRKDVCPKCGTPEREGEAISDGDVEADTKPPARAFSECAGISESAGVAPCPSETLSSTVQSDGIVKFDKPNAENKLYRTWKAAQEDLAASIKQALDLPVYRLAPSDIAKHLHIICGPNGRCLCGIDGKTCGQILSTYFRDIRDAFIAGSFGGTPVELPGLTPQPTVMEVGNTPPNQPPALSAREAVIEWLKENHFGKLYRLGRDVAISTDEAAATGARRFEEYIADVEAKALPHIAEIIIEIQNTHAATLATLSADVESLRREVGELSNARYAEQREKERLSKALEFYASVEAGE